MVYCGKPSRGCQNCKTRRIKCDEVRPTCTQCRKSNRECPGYPDEFDLIFRNETTAVKRRAQRAFTSTSSSSTRKNVKTASASKEARVSSSPTDSNLTWGTSASDASPQSDELADDDEVVNIDHKDTTRPRKVEAAYDPPSIASLVEQIEEAALREMESESGRTLTLTRNFNSRSSLPMSLAFSREVASTSFFIKNFAIPPRQKDSMRGYLEVLYPIYENAPMGSLVHKATQAVALASLSNGFKTRVLRMEAQKLYGKALLEVGEAIKDPVIARSDELLMSILLFSLYEAITSTQESRGAWTHHISGAVQLVRLRGEEQLKNPVSLHLFRAVRSAMLTSSIVQGRIIDDFPAPGGWSCDDDGDLNAANRLTLICLRLPNIKRYAQDLLAQEKTPKVVSEMMLLIRTAKEIDSQLEHWALTVPEEWEYHTMEYCREEPKDVYMSQFWRGPIHKYYDLNVANIINDYRISRIFCQAVILGCISALPLESKTSATDRASAHATYLTQQMVDDFSSSIPYLLGYKIQGLARTTGMTEGSLRATGSYFAAWPLYVTKSIPCVPMKQRQWLAGRLSFIGKCFGLNEHQILSFAKKHVLTSGPSFSPSQSCASEQESTIASRKLAQRVV